MNGIERRVMNIYRIKSDADKVWIKKEHSSDLVLVSVHGGGGGGATGYKRTEKMWPYVA